MAKRQPVRKSAIQVVAQAAGRTVNLVAESVESIQARHPDPVAEVQAALATAAEKIGTVTAAAYATKDAAVKRTRAAAERVQQLAGRARKTTTKAAKRLTKAVLSDKKTPSTGVRSARKPVRKAGNPKSSVLPGAVVGPRKSATRTARGRSAAAMEPVSAANVKRRQAHASSQTKRRQARRDKKG